MQTLSDIDQRNLTSVRVRFPRPEFGPRWEAPRDVAGLKLGHEAGWQSNGGSKRGDPLRSLPYSVDVALPEIGGKVKSIALVGVFGLCADCEHEAHGTLGASVQVVNRDEILFRQDLLNGIHYSDARETRAIDSIVGDGSSLQTVGECSIAGATTRVDLLEIDVDTIHTPQILRFKDLGSPASFVLFDMFVKVEPIRGCPFRAASGGFPLSDLGVAVRVGDRVKFGRAVDQLERAIRSTQDLDEARGQGLTFLAVATAAMIDFGGGREMHRTLLGAARAVESARTVEEALERIRAEIQALMPAMFASKDDPSAKIVDRSLALVERNFAKDLSDSAVAAEVGLSTSHFRFLFREATGQPFHKYLVAVRLEKARAMLTNSSLPVSQVASAVGFSGLSHFSRAFSNRFSVSPISVRRTSQ